MSKFHLENNIARLIILQRIELASPFLKKIRKLLGRYIFSNYISKYFLNVRSIEKKYYTLMNSELELLKKNIDFENKNILSIGGGTGGLEALINKKYDCSFCFIEKNYISKKVKYGWDDKNLEAYNNLSLVELFLKNNGMEPGQFKIFDFDTETLPEGKFDFIVSLYSLDYHYDFNIYLDYLRRVSHNDTKIIFDTIRGEYFKKIFKNVNVIQSQINTVHKSKRIICNEFI